MSELLTEVSESTLGGVLWDMDGTLLDSEKLWDIALRELSLRLGGPMTEATRIAVIGASSPFALATVFDALGLGEAPRCRRRGEGLDVHPRRRSVRGRRDLAAGCSRCTGDRA